MTSRKGAPAGGGAPGARTTTWPARSRIRGGLARTSRRARRLPPGRAVAPGDDAGRGRDRGDRRSERLPAAGGQPGELGAEQLRPGALAALEEQRVALDVPGGVELAGQLDRQLGHRLRGASRDPRQQLRPCPPLVPDEQYRSDRSEAERSRVPCRARPRGRRPASVGGDDAQCGMAVVAVLGVADGDQLPVARTRRRRWRPAREA